MIIIFKKTTFYIFNMDEYVYIIQSEHEIYKIGKSKDVEDRIKGCLLVN